DILQKTGYDTLLTSDKMFTVFAPVNSALTGVDMNNMESLKSLVRNHLAYANYSISNGSFGVERIQMINEKKLLVDGLKINNVSVASDAGKYNLTTANGILHLMNGIIPSQKNIWEYLQGETNNLQVDYIKAQDRLIMDMDKSVQIGVTPSGKPLYDTIWRNENPFMILHPVNDESKNYTYALLPNTVVQRIESKYAKYFEKADQAKRDSIVRSELIADCILAPVVITADGRYASVGGVLMNISAANIRETYQASNGIVYRLSDADVKIYENKVKTLKIEGENYYSFYADNMNAWMMRERPTLSGGRDMVLNSPTVYLTKYLYSDADTTISVDINRTFSPSNGSYNVGRVNNCYIEYRQVINSVPYKIYWSAYDDYPSHINLPVSLSINTGKQTVTVDTAITCQFSQKMLISFPDQPRVNRLTTGNIENNFSPLYVFTSKRFKAGVQEEKQLFRANGYTDVTWSPLVAPVRTSNYMSDEDNFSFYTDSDTFGDMETIINPTYGVATFYIANTTEVRGTSPGMIFLDYFKLVPVVDPNE
ncbi:MAG: fasciclin domain-containing protein, partial [Paludibacteraceae bacterium]